MAVCLGPGAQGATRLFVRANAAPGGDGLSWATAHRFLGDAISQANVDAAISEVFVAAGVYRPDQTNANPAGTNNRSAYFRLTRDGVKVYGGFAGTESSPAERVSGANTTVLSGDIGAVGDPTDNSRNIIALDTSSISSATCFDGMTISAGQNIDCPQGGPCDPRGSAVRLQDCSPAFIGCIFTGNNAGDGGAVYALRSNATFNGCTLTSNHANNNGGAVYTLLSSCIFNGCTLTSNSAGSGGGALYVEAGSPSTVSNCTLAGNIGSVFGGGAISALGNSIRISDCTFDSNATGLSLLAKGGALFLSTGNGQPVSTPTIERCLFIGNTSTLQVGGAAFAYQTAPSFTSCRFLGNVATNGGGALYLDLLPASPPPPIAPTATVSGCLFSGNRTSVHSVNSGGGAIATRQALTVSNCTMTQNTADVGGAIAAGSPTLALTVVNSILYGNTALGATDPSHPWRPQIVGPSDTDLYDLRYCCVQGGYPGITNIASEPRLADPMGVDGVAGTLDDDASLLPASPCIDAGSSPLVPAALTIDLAGNPRFADDPSSPDTGVGPAPLVDLGAFEFSGSYRRWINLAGGSFAQAANWFLGVPGAGDDAVFPLAGQYTVSTSGSSTVGRVMALDGDVTLNAAGGTLNASSVVIGPVATSTPTRLAVIGGTVSAGSARVFPSGVLSGNGTVQAAVTNTGNVDPESDSGDPAKLTIGGSYQQLLGARSGSLTFDAASSQSHDELQIGGVATLGGSLIFRLASGFVPAPMQLDHMRLLSAAGLDPSHDRFDVAYLPGLPGNRYLKVEYAAATQRTTASVTLVEGTLSSDSGLTPNNFNAAGRPAAALLADLNNDGRLDLALAIPDAASPTTNLGQVAILLNAGNGGGAWSGFTAQTTLTVGRQPSALAAGKLRGANQASDLVVANRADNSISIIRWGGGNTFSVVGVHPSGGVAPVALVTGELRTPGVVDVVIGNYGSPADLDPGNMTRLDGNGAGGLSPNPRVYFPGAQPVGLVAADFDGDGLIDLASANSGSENVAVYSQAASGGGTYLPPVRYPTSGQPQTIAPGGMDNPKDLDLVTINSGSNSASLLLHDGNGGFSPAVNLPLGSTPRSLAILDIDQDGDNDIVTVTDAAAPGSTALRLLRNDTNDGEQLVISPAADLPSNNPSLILAGDVNNDAGHRTDLVALGETAPLRGAPGERAVLPVQVLLNRCRTDLNADGAINTLDLIQLLQRFGQNVAPGTSGDVDGSGAVNTLDLILLLQRFGQVCG